MLEIGTTKNMKGGDISQRELSVSRFVPYSRHIDDTTIKTKEGYLLKVIKISGIPFETSDEADLNQHKNVRANLLKGLSSSRFAVYYHIIRRQTQTIQNSFFDNEWCAELDKAYKNKLSSKKMFVNEQYITIVRRPSQGAIGLATKLGSLFFNTIDRTLLAGQESENLKALEDATHNVLKTLSPYNPELLATQTTATATFSEPLSFLYYLINFEKKDIRLPRMSLCNYLPSKRISFGKEVFELRGSAANDTKIGAVISLKEYTEGTGPGMLDSLLRLPHEFIVTQSFAFVDRQAALNNMKTTKRKFIASEQGAVSLEEDVDDAINDLASGRSAFGEHHLTVTVAANSSRDLETSLSNVVGCFHNLGIITSREDINLEAAYWAQLPGNFSYIARRSLISNRNFAGFASFHTFPTGRAFGNHWGEAITRLETTSGTPYWFNFHERDVGNTTVIGPTGTGKTVLLTFIHAQAQRMSPKSVYFDKDRGAEIYLRAIGSDYTIVENGLPTGLNPLQITDSPDNRAFLRDWIKLLATLDNSAPLTSRDIAIIADAVDANFEGPPHERKLSIFCQLLGGHEIEHDSSLKNRMQKWHGKGSHAWLFDNEEDSLSLDNKSVAFDLTSILDDNLSRTPWLMYVFYRINAMLNGEKVIIMLDEGWKMLDDPEFSARIKDWMKTIRKQNGILVFATQSAKDALNSSVGDAIIEQSPTQIFLPNPKGKEADYCDGFGLTKRELQLIREIPFSSRAFLIKHGNDSVVAQLDLSGMDQFVSVLSGRTETVNLMNQIINECGHNPENWLPVFHERRAQL